MDIKGIIKNFNFRTRFFRTLFFITADVFFIFFSIWLAFLLKFDGAIPKNYFSTIFQTSVLSLIFLLPIFYFQKLYSFSWSYVGAQEMISLFKSVSVAFIFIALAIFISDKYPAFIGFPRSTLFISYFLIFLFCGSIRLSKRICLDIFKKEKVGRKKTLIIGAGDAGEQILRSILGAGDTQYKPVGFVDDSNVKQGVLIHGVKVLGKINNLKKVIKDSKAECVIIALSSIELELIKKVVEQTRQAGIKKIKIIPSISEIIDGGVSVRELREVQVGDLLGRNVVCLDTKSIEEFIKNKLILITGAAGSIGSELVRQVAKFKPSNLILIDHDETGIFNISNEILSDFPQIKIKSFVADIKDKENIEKIFSKLKPNIVFHAAAYKHVPILERQPDEAIKNNIFGTKIVAEASLKFSADKFIFISTDKAVNPKSVLGVTKRIGEMMCQVLNNKNEHTKYISVRFGNVLDSRGSVIPTFRDQIKKGGPVTVTHPDMKRYFMLIPEACLLVLQASSMGEGGEVFVLDMGKPVKILDLAKEMIKLSGLEPDKDVPIVFTNPRPGEKMFEEILTAEEGTIATQNQKIFMAKLSLVDGKKLEDSLNNLENIIKENDASNLIKVLEYIVPFYKK